MKINNYTLTYDPQSMEQSNTSLYSELQVPFGDNVILDMGATTEKYDFDIVLVDDEINDITGMIKGYKLIYLEFGDVEGFFYVTQFDLTWIKKLNNRQYASFKISGYLSKSPYLRLGSFSDSQQTDFPATRYVYLTLPKYYTSKRSLTATYDHNYTTRSGKNILYFLDPPEEIKFKASKDLISEGYMRVWKGTKRIYQNNTSDSELKIDSNNQIYKFPYNSSTKIMDLENYAGTNIFSLSDSLNYLTGTDTYMEFSPFRTKIKANHTEFIIKANRPYFEIKKSPQNITHTATELCSAIKPDVAIGTKTLTTTDPNTLMRDSRIAAGTPPIELSYLYTPGFYKVNWGENTGFLTFTTQANTHPYNGFYNGTERNYMSLSYSTYPFIYYIGSGDWTLTNFTARTDGGTYNGITDYVSSSTANATVSKTLTFGTAGAYDIYLMASNYDDCPVGTYEFYIDGVLKGTTSQLKWAITDTKANFVYLGSHRMSSIGGRTFMIKLKTGKIGVFYMIIVPNTDTYIGGAQFPLDIINSAFMDTNEGVEV